VANDELLLPILKTFEHCTQYTLLEMRVVFSLCLGVELSVAPTNRSLLPRPSKGNNTRTPPDTPTICGNHLLVCHLYINARSAEKPSELAQTVTCLTCIREGLGSSLGHDHDFTDFFVIFLSLSNRMLQQYKLGYDHFHVFTKFQIVLSFDAVLFELTLH
jgi:hypothetical protein